MDTQLLHTLQVVCERGTTQGAAGVLGISQSAVSRRLSQIEAELGLTLFHRQNGRLIPTPENRALHGPIAALLAQSARLQAQAREMGSGRPAVQVLKVAFPASMTLTLVPDIIAQFAESHPHVQVELQTGTYDVIERMLRDNRAEIGFLRMPARQAGIALTPLIEAGTVCVLPETHLLAARRTIALRDLAGEPMILLGKARQPRHEIDQLFMAAGLAPRIRVEAHSVMSACALAARGLGITIVNGLMARDYAHLPVAIRPLRERLQHHFAFAMAAAGPVPDIADDFMASAADHLANLPGVRRYRSAR